MIRTLWQKRDRLNLWAWLARLEGVMVHHMADLAKQRELNQRQAGLNRATHTLTAAHTDSLIKVHQRLVALEQSAGKDHVVRIFPGPFSDHGKEQC